jgi:DNA-binding transcriptional regulator YiaG
MKQEFSGSETVIVQEAPVVRISDAGRVRAIQIAGRRVGGHKGIHGSYVLETIKNLVRRSRTPDEPYVGCLWRSDDAVALFSVDRLDKSVDLHWERGSRLRDLAEETDEMSADDADDDKARPRTPPRVVSIPDINAIEDRAPVTRVTAGEAPLRGAELIRRMRNVRGMSRSQLAQRLGVKPSRVAELELGKGPQGPTLGMLARIAEACEVDLNITLGLAD